MKGWARDPVRRKGRRVERLGQRRNDAVGIDSEVFAPPCMVGRH